MRDTLHKICDTAMVAVGVFMMAGLILLVTQRHGAGAEGLDGHSVCAEVKEQLLEAVEADIITEFEAQRLADNCRRSYERGR